MTIDGFNKVIGFYVIQGGTSLGEIAAFNQSKFVDRLSTYTKHEQS